MNDTKIVKCGFAYPGTYGHECGKPAILFAVKRSNSTKSGFFYAGRCAECAKVQGLENRDVIWHEPLNGQKNEWR